MDEKSNKKRKIFAITGFSLSIMLIGVTAYCSACVPNTMVKAETSADYPYIYKYSYIGQPLTNNFDDDVGYYRDILYIDGKTFKNLDYFRIEPIHSKIVMYFNDDGYYNRDYYYADLSTLAYVPYNNANYLIQNSDMFTRYTYNGEPYTMHWVDEPTIINAFDYELVNGMLVTKANINAGYYDLYSGCIVANNTTYSKLRLRMLKLDGYTFSIGDMYYSYSASEYPDYKNRAWAYGLYLDNTLIYKAEGSTNGAVIAGNKYQWVNQNYRNMTFYGTNGTLSTLTKYYNQDYITVVKALNGYVERPTNESLNDAFDLIALIFSSITPLFMLSIAPGVTLMALILVPVLIAVILAIIKLVKR